MADEEESEELVMIAEKARSLLNRSERQILSHCCHSYLSGRMDVHHFVDSLLRLLPTPDKATFLVELRELVREEDYDEYDYRVFTVPSRPFRSIQLQSGNSLDYEQSTECLLQVERVASTGNHHSYYQNYQLLSQGNSANCSPDIRESSRATKSLKTMDFESPTLVIGTSIQPLAALPFRVGLKETNIPMMSIDMTTAFPTSVKPLMASTNNINKLPASRPVISDDWDDRIGRAVLIPQVYKESLAGQQNGGAPTKQKQLPVHKNTTTRRTGCRLPVSDDEPMEVVIRKTKKMLGVAIEGGINTRHPLPRIITIDGKGTAFEAAGLRIGQTILQVDGIQMEGLTHEEAARLIANSYADRSVPELKLLMSPSTFRPNANYQPEN